MEMTGPDLALGLVWFIVFLFSTTVHEAAHAWSALRLGDPTAYHGGQVTLNPWPHIRREPFGMVIVPILTWVMSSWVMGWASAPYDPIWAQRYPKRSALMALAGPASNFLLMLGSAVALRVGLMMGAFTAPAQGSFKLSQLVAASEPGTGAALATFLSVAFSLNLLLFIFNLLPVPPLDGSAILPLAMSHEMAARWQGFIRQPMMALLGIVIAWRLIGLLFQPLLFLGLGLLYSGLG